MLWFAVVLIGFVEGYVLLPFGLVAFLGAIFLTAFVVWRVVPKWLRSRQSIAARDATFFTLCSIYLDTPFETNFLSLFLGACI